MSAIAEEMNAYRKQHMLCPQCNGENYSVTTMGFFRLDDGATIDRNRVSCACGWRGIAHDLLPKTPA